MLRPEPIGRDQLRSHARQVTDQLTVLADLWLLGAPPTPAQVRAIAGQLAQLRHAAWAVPSETPATPTEPSP